MDEIGNVHNFYHNKEVGLAEKVLTWYDGVKIKRLDNNYGETQELARRIAQTNIKEKTQSPEEIKTSLMF